MTITQLYRATGRVAYWVLYPALWIYLYRSRRVYVIVRVADEVLLIKNWLGNGQWTFPGGGMMRGETAKTGAVREVREELGLQLDEGRLRSLGVWNHHGRGFLYRYYELNIRERPQLQLQREEIVAAKWVDRADLGQYIHPKEYGIITELLSD